MGLVADDGTARVPFPFFSYILDDRGERFSGIHLVRRTFLLTSASTHIFPEIAEPLVEDRFPATLHKYKPDLVINWS
jgi:hypothetical protein